MSATLILIGACISLASSLVKLVGTFKRETQKFPATSGHGNGFWSYYSYSNIANVQIPTDKISNYIEKRLINKITASSFVSEETKADLLWTIEDYLFVEGWLSGGMDTAVASISYRKTIGKIYLYCITMSVDPTFIWGPVVNVNTMRSEIEYVLAKDWVIYGVATVGAFSSKIGFEKEYLETGLTPERVIDAVAISFAPIYLGLVKVPPKFMETIAKSLVCNPESEAFQGLSEEDQKLLEQFAKDAQDRQKKNYDDFKQDVQQILNGTAFEDMVQTPASPKLSEK